MKEDYDDSEDYTYCDGCETDIHNDDLDWLNDCPLCPNCQSIINI